MADETLTPEQATTLAEFARVAKTAVRSVSLYPATHPSIQAALRRVAEASTRLTVQGDVTIAVQPDVLTIDGRAPAKIDASIAELASLLHDRLVGSLRIDKAADAADWHALLLLLSRAPEDLFAVGGLGQSWAETGRNHFEIREIDYAEVLRERAGSGDAAAWDRIVAFCLRGEGQSMDDAAFTLVLDALADSSRLSALIERLEGSAGSGATIGARAAALMKLLHGMAGALQQRRPGSTDSMLQTAASALGRLTPDMLMALMEEARRGSPDERAVVHDVVGRMDDSSIASFVGTAIATERGASERLAQAFEALVPELDRKERLLARTHDDLEASPFGQEAGFEELWQNAASLLTSYSDKNYVSAEYGRELSGARTQALEIERVSDDPPDRVRTWLATVSDSAIGELDAALLRDLLRLEDEQERWRSIAAIAGREIERQVVLGNVRRVELLLQALVVERNADGRPHLQAVAASTIDALASGQLVRHVVLQLRKADEADVDPLKSLCYTIGPSVVRPLAEALAAEENSRAIRRLRELLLGFGAAGRQSVEQLKSSSNPAVRRTAIDLLRVFGGDEALPELASMLDDDDPQVQRESIRAIVQIATRQAYAILERAVVAGRAAGDTILQELIAMRDDKAVPLLCHALNHTVARGRLVQVHVQVMEALGGLTGGPETTRTLREALYRGRWWAPVRTATLRHAAAAALRRVGSPESLAVLEEASAKGSRGVRNAVKPHLGAALRRERTRA